MGMGLMRMGMMGGSGTSDGGRQGTRRNKVAYIKREQAIDAVSCVASCVRGDVSVIGRHIIISFQMASP